MKTKQLINGGQASPTSIYYWMCSGVSVASDSSTSHYRIAAGGSMGQTCRIPVQGNIRISGTYCSSAYAETLIFKTTITYDDGSTMINIADLYNSELNEWSVFEVAIDTEDNKIATSIDFSISYDGGIYGRIANISALVYYTEQAGSISSSDFMEKAILYGLDADKPSLTNGGDTDD